MKMRGFWTTACTALLIAGLAAAAYSQPKQQDTRVSVEPKYIRVEPIEVADHPENFVGKSVEIKDRFDQGTSVQEWPREVRRHGIQPDTHVAFHTHRVTGSNMLCFVARADEQSLKVLQDLVRESPITMVGDLLDRARGETIFLVSRVWRGHVAPPMVEKRRLVITFKAPGEDTQPVQYTIPELNKYFVVSVPTTSGGSVKLHIKAELR